MVDVTSFRPNKFKQLIRGGMMSKSRQLELTSRLGSGHGWLRTCLLVCAALIALPAHAANADAASPAPIVIPTGLGDVTEVTIRPNAGAQSRQVQFEIKGYPLETYGMALISDRPLRQRIWFYLPNSKWSRKTNGWYSEGFEPLKKYDSNGFYYKAGAGGMIDNSNAIRYEFEPIEAGQETNIRVTFFKLTQLNRGLLKDLVQHVLTREQALARLANVNRRLDAENAAELAPHGAIIPPLTLSGPKPDVPANIKPVLHPYAERLLAEGRRNAVVNLSKLGLVALENGLLAEAEWSFDRAIREIETINSDNTAAEKSRTIYGMEAMKDFKGEPYERAMLFYYRGVIYLARGDYQNARAAFKSAELFDTMASTEAAQSDFALLQYLMGWSSMCINDPSKANEAFGLASKADPNYSVPNKDTNTLALFETGAGPVKERRGNQFQLLTFTPSIDEERGATVALRVGARDIPLSASTSIFTQASTRGGRPIDYVLAGEAKLYNQAGVAALGAAMLLGPVGLLISELSSKIRPEADSRTWETLPDRVALGTMAAKPGDPLSFSFQPKDAQARTVKPMLSATAGRCRIVWARSRSAMETGPGTYGDDADAMAMRAKSEALSASDAAFIADLRRDMAAL
jgi:tetratricopeptide (TPR) repeat protein